MAKKLDYHKSVNYDIADPAKVLAQKAGRATAGNFPFGFKEVDGTRGESAYVFSMGHGQYGALVQEGLGTKSLIAQAVYAKTGVSHFQSTAQDTVATVINDLISVGATPVALNAYWSSSSYDWLGDPKITKDFITGWRKACDRAGVVWGGGETQSLPGVVADGALEFAGCGFGVVKSKRHLIQDKNIKAGDAIIFLAGSGVHANGISLAREIAAGLPKGYQTKLPGGQTFGEALLTPTPLYAKAVKALQEAKIPIHYLANITGHGWRKIMRGNQKLTYIIDKSPAVQPVFGFIQKHSGNSLREMYGNYNMGAGYAVYLPAKHAEAAVKVIRKAGTKAWISGRVEAGPKQVVIVEQDITFDGRTLEVR